MLKNRINGIDSDERYVLAMIQSTGESTRQELIANSKFGISKTDLLIKKLINKGLVVAKDGFSQKRGRNPFCFGVNPDLYYFIGADLNFVRDFFVMMDFSGQKIFSLKMNPSYQATSILDTLEEHLHEFVKKSRVPIGRIMKIGLGLHGLVDSLRGKVSFRPKSGRVIQEYVGDFIKDKFGIPTVIAQQKFFRMVNLYHKGDYKRYQTIASLNLGTGVGLSCVMDGRYYFGEKGLAGQVAHIKIDDGDYPCYCGDSGCLITKVSYEGICREALGRIGRGFYSSLNEETLSNVDHRMGVDHIVDQALLNDKLSINIISEIAVLTARILAFTITVLNPSLVNITSDLVRAGHLFCGIVRFQLQKLLLKELFDDLEIRFMPPEPEAVAEGAAYFMLRSFLAEDESLESNMLSKTFVPLNI